MNTRPLLGILSLALALTPACGSSGKSSSSSTTSTTSATGGPSGSTSGASSGTHSSTGSVSATTTAGTVSGSSGSTTIATGSSGSTLAASTSTSSSTGASSTSSSSGANSTSSSSGSTGTPYPASCANGATPTHLPQGFSNLGFLPGDIYDTSMALDENDDPVFVYLSGQVPDGGPDHVSDQGYYMTRWDPCAGAITEPLFIDTTGIGGIASGTVNVQVAYDVTTREIGVVYIKSFNCERDQTEICSNSYFTSVWFASLKAGTSAFALQYVSPNYCYGPLSENGDGPLNLADPEWACLGSSPGATGDVSNASSPSIVMSRGQVYLSFLATYYGSTYDGTFAPYLLSSTSALPGLGQAEDGGLATVDGGEIGNLAAGTPPHYFEVQVLDMGMEATASQENALDWTSLAVDSSGQVGAAFFASDSSNNISWLAYASGGTTTIVAQPLLGSNGLPNSVSLAFAGTSPRMAGVFGISVDGGTSQEGNFAVYVSSSDTGSTWNPVETVYYLPVGAETTSLAVGGSGDEYLVSPVSDSFYQGGCTAGLEFTESTNSGVSFPMCSVTSMLSGGLLGALGPTVVATGTTRLPGEAMVGSTGEVNSPDGGLFEDVLMYYQAP